MKGNSDELTRERGEVGTLKKPSAKKSNQKLLVPPESPASHERQKGPLRSRCPGAALRRLAAWRGEQQWSMKARPREWSAGHHRAWRAVEAERRTERAHCGGQLRLAPSRACQSRPPFVAGQKESTTIAFNVFFLPSSRWLNTTCWAGVFVFCFFARGFYSAFGRLSFFPQQCQYGNAIVEHFSKYVFPLEFKKCFENQSVVNGHKGEQMYLNCVNIINQPEYPGHHNTLIN